MRHSALFTIALCATLASFQSPAAAEETFTYGSSVCAAKIKCPDETKDPKPYIAQALPCIARVFGFNTSVEVFDVGRGLDYNQCLVAITSQKFGSGLNPLKPQCCVTKTDTEQVCSLTCKLVGTR